MIAPGWHKRDFVSPGICHNGGLQGDTRMGAASDATRFYSQIKTIPFFGRAGSAMPEEAVLDARMQAGALLLPQAYQAAYVAPVRAGTPRLLALARQQRIHMSSVEIVTGGIYQHAEDWPNGPALRRFVAVTSNLYRSFLDAARRAAVGMPSLGEVLPPLAAFTSDGSAGPTTLAVDLTRAFMDAQVGVVALPATMADHPILWMTLVHETGGHDVTHADTGLLPELTARLPAVLAPFRGETGLSDAELAALWGHWMDEASADIFALLNAGPAFAENLAVMLAAMGGGAAPALRMVSAPGGDSLLDPHPTDILRLHLLIGGLAALDGFAGQAAATLRLRELADSFGTGSTIALRGNLPAGPQSTLPLSVTAKREGLTRCAEAVGRAIAETPLTALGGKPIRRIETWDDADQRAVDAIRNALAARRPIAGLGDDAQLLAAATGAVMDGGTYDTATASLAAGLDDSFRTDPIWRLPEPDRMYLRYR